MSGSYSTKVEDEVDGNLAAAKIEGTPCRVAPLLSSKPDQSLRQLTG